MNDERLPRHWSTTKAYDALQRLIEGKHRLHIPVQESDEDRIIAAVIDERDALTAALDAATARRSADEARLAAVAKWDEVRLRLIAANNAGVGNDVMRDLYDEFQGSWDELWDICDAQRADAASSSAGEG